MGLTTKDIQNHFYKRNQKRFSLIIPNCYPGLWWESDLFCLSKSDYFYEYEIKISRSDFYAEANKIDRQGVSKHLHLQNGNSIGPSVFYFITPQDLITVNDVPDYAGLVYAYKKSNNAKCIRFQEVKKGRRLHSVKFPADLKQRMISNLYFRYWGERLRDK